MTTCPICLEEIDHESGSTVVLLDCCGKEFCCDCLQRWILQREGHNDALEFLTCPNCRTSLSEEFLQKLLGRPIQKKCSEKSATNSHGDDEAEMDEFTVFYLHEQGARQCPRCSIWIIRESGCDNMMCRCGARFCMCCGNYGTCTGGSFFDNVRNVEEESLSSYRLDFWDDIIGERERPLAKLFGDDKTCFFEDIQERDELCLPNLFASNMLAS